MTGYFLAPRINAFISQGAWTVFRVSDIARDLVMDSLFTQNLSEEPGDIPQTQEPVWILGKQYDATKELDAIRKDIRSRLWCTYRKGFVPIGNNVNFTSDRGWGCMLRCGQMVLAQALIALHLGKEWQWTPETRDKTYLKILSKFEDKRTAPFSIHLIALMGASEGKEVGQWFGPNTVAQVLKKLVVYDEWSSITIHVALDNTLVINDVLKLCRVEGGTAVVENNDDESLKAPNEWKPLLLLIPLRLGLNEINSIYINGLKSSFRIPQSLGLIGGKPNLALYFIGCVGDQVIYLDPHTTQRHGCVDEKLLEEQVELDQTYHCKAASRIPIADLDPSMALCFFCATEQDFESLCRSIQRDLVTSEGQSLFELCTERPADWSPVDDTPSEALEGMEASNVVNFEQLERQYDTSDEDFELIG